MQEAKTDETASPEKPGVCVCEMARKDQCLNAGNHQYLNSDLLHTVSVHSLKELRGRLESGD